MSQNRIITAIDVGTDKVVTLIAAHDTGLNKLRVMGVSAVPSRGMKRSQIIDLEKVLESITESLDGAERMAGLDVKSAFVSVSGTHINSRNSKGVVAVASPDQEIIAEDVERVIEAARAVSLPSDREIIHVIPKDFKVDSQEGIKDPLGMTGVRLESEAHIITGMSTALKNLKKCIEDIGLQVNGFVFAGLAAAEVVLSETERELGVAVVDIGAGSTSMCVYVDGSLEYSTTIPIGARHITQDVALGSRVSLDIAERIKISLSDDPFHTMSPQPGESKKEFSMRRKKADKLELATFKGPDTNETLSKRSIVENIMVPRIQEIFDLIADELEEHNLTEEIPAGLVLSGGGAETVKITEIAKRHLNLPVRIGDPIELEGLITDIQKPSYATSIGLLVYGKKQGDGEAVSQFNLGAIFDGVELGNIWQKISSFFKSLLPWEKIDIANSLVHGRLWYTLWH